MRTVAVFVLFALLLPACVPITISVTIGQPTPTATATLQPTVAVASPPQPTAAPPATSAPGSRCIVWAEAAAHMGETTCVRGTVYSTNKSGNTFFIDFDNTRTSFYGVSFRHTWDNLRGKCVEITGKISPYRGRPQIIIEDREQVRLCD